jgi:hypothetical protein
MFTQTDRQTDTHTHIYIYTLTYAHSYGAAKKRISVTYHCLCAKKRYLAHVLEQT